MSSPSSRASGAQPVLGNDPESTRAPTHAKAWMRHTPPNRTEKDRQKKMKEHMDRLNKLVSWYGEASKMDGGPASSEMGDVTTAVCWVDASKLYKREGVSPSVMDKLLEIVENNQETLFGKDSSLVAFSNKGKKMDNRRYSTIMNGYNVVAPMTEPSWKNPDGSAHTTVRDYGKFLIKNMWQSSSQDSWEENVGPTGRNLQRYLPGFLGDSMQSSIYWTPISAEDMQKEHDHWLGMTEIQQEQEKETPTFPERYDVMPTVLYFAPTHALDGTGRYCRQEVQNSDLPYGKVVPVDVLQSIVDETLRLYKQKYPYAGRNGKSRYFVSQIGILRDGKFDQAFHTDLSRFHEHWAEMTYEFAGCLPVSFIFDLHHESLGEEGMIRHKFREKVGHTGKVYQTKAPNALMFTGNCEHLGMKHEEKEYRVHIHVDVECWPRRNDEVGTKDKPRDTTKPSVFMQALDEEAIGMCKDEYSEESWAKEADGFLTEKKEKFVTFLQLTDPVAAQKTFVGGTTKARPGLGIESAGWGEQMLSRYTWDFYKQNNKNHSTRKRKANVRESHDEEESTKQKRSRKTRRKQPPTQVKKPPLAKKPGAAKKK